MHEAPPSLWRACINLVINNSLLCESQKLIKNNDTSPRNSSQKHLWNSGTFGWGPGSWNNGFKPKVFKPNPQPVNSMDSLPWPYGSLDQAFKRQSIPWFYAILRILNFPGKKEKKVWSQLHWLPYRWQSSLRLCGFICSVTFLLKLLGLGRKEDSGGWYFTPSICSEATEVRMTWEVQGITLSLHLSHSIIEKAVTGKVKHWRA